MGAQEETQQQKRQFHVRDTPMLRDAMPVYGFSRVFPAHQFVRVKPKKGVPNCSRQARYTVLIASLLRTTVVAHRDWRWGRLEIYSVPGDSVSSECRFWL